MSEQRAMHVFDTMTEPELRQFFNELAKSVAERMPPKTGFILLCAPLGEGGGVTQYVSNIARETAEPFMLETLLRWSLNEQVER